LERTKQPTEKKDYKSGDCTMNNRQPMTTEQFTKRLVNLCLRSGLSGMPKDEVDQHILLKSAALVVGTQDTLTEKEITEKLQVWLTQVCVIQNFDRVTLRRWLIDAGHLTRNKNGTDYQVANPGPRPDLFEPAIDQIDPLEIIRTARDEMERRKQAFLEKATPAQSAGTTRTRGA
jgi:hypothetical protein